VSGLGRVRVRQWQETEGHRQTCLHSPPDLQWAETEPGLGTGLGRKHLLLPGGEQVVGWAVGRKAGCEDSSRGLTGDSPLLTLNAQSKALPFCFLSEERASCLSLPLPFLESENGAW
jgi:hypothetical protein